MLIAKDISKTYILNERKGFFIKKKSEFNALKKLDLTIKPGSIVGLLGVNGAGKSTTIKILSTILAPTTGSLKVNGVNALKYPVEAKKLLNVITGGERNLYWRLTARENLEYFGALYGLSKKELKDYIPSSLNLVGLKDSHIPVERYSKGMKQRLQIARGLINNPKYLFLDEPTLGLDINIAKELRQYIKKLAHQKNKGILLTTHYLSEVEELCDWVYIIDKGILLTEGTPSDIASQIIPGIKLKIELSNLSCELKKELLNYVGAIDAKINFFKNHHNYSISLSSKDDLTSDVVNIITKYRTSILSFKTEEPNLEDALLTLTSKKGDSIYELVKSN
ncbi:ABC transporter ATP-binding protein [Bacillus nakamurai]|uniref:ABC transporter ATP-binding protein n=1 Tax=Bacillus nakamurai TaxID=1793963 RepID=UPI001E44F16D|nr:ABC transporter ATP-binding protein [Bacillus nakamurai]MCC9022362.1 ABC transporter ATP-binding protein [Bacillus nakamurai]